MSAALSIAERFPDGNTPEQAAALMAELQEQSRRERYKSAKDVCDTEYPETTWFVEGVISEGYGLIVGPPKAGKSFLVLGIALAVASGRKALGGLKTLKRPVLYMSLEDTFKRLNERIKHINIEDDTFILDVPENLTLAINVPAHSILDDMDWWLSENPGGLIILDTLAHAMTDQRVGQSAYQRDVEVGKKFTSLLQKHPESGILAVHHTRKAEGNGYMDQTSGTNGVNGTADYTVNLSSTGREGLLQGKGRIAEAFELSLSFNGGRWALFGDGVDDAKAHAKVASAEQGLGEVGQAIIRVLSEHPEGMSPSDVHNALGGKHGKDYITTAMTRMFNSGRILRPSRGRYVLPSEESKVDAAEMLSEENDDE